MEIRTIAILGPGLLGGSLALELSEKGGVELRLWARRSEVLSEARSLGIRGILTDSLEEAVAGADLVVLATPVGAMPALARRIAALPNKPLLVTDMGSVKGMVEMQVAPILRDAGIAFIGAHPMCGSEQKGLAAARFGLFRNAMCLLTPQADEDSIFMERLQGFWKSIGCRIACMDPMQHDDAVARVSHLPHASAALVAAVSVGGRPELIPFSAGGFRDTTRVASGPPDMWTEILLENRSAMVPLLREMAEKCEMLASALENERSGEVHATLEAGQLARAPLPDSTSSSMF